MAKFCWNCFKMARECRCFFPEWGTPPMWEPEVEKACVMCAVPITSCELCEQCAEKNEPVTGAKYAGDYHADRASARG